MTDQDQLTEYLRKWAEGNADAAETLIPLVYAELHRMASAALAREAVESTPPTSLVHDLFLQLVAQRKVQWEDRRHFFGIASRLLRQILVARARKRNALKRGAGRSAEPLDVVIARTDGLGPEDVIQLDRALEGLARLDESKARLVELRYFGGLSLEETAEALGISLATVKRQWEFSRRWLYKEMSGEGTANGSRTEDDA
jgi:RNA polymerase sigma-70 factor, ECF subfamily